MARTKSIAIHKGLAVDSRCAAAGLQPTPRQLKALTEFDEYNKTNSFQYEGSLLNRMTGRTDVTYGLRQPVPEETTAALMLSQRCNEISIAGDRMDTVKSLLPPGKPKFSRMVANRVASQRGELPTKKAYNRRRITPSPRTEIKAGVLIDVSGSMTHYSMLGLSLAWVIGSAINQLGGKVATVLFSNLAVPVASPTEQSNAVVMTGTSAGDHVMSEAQLMADGALDLIDGDGARLLFVFSDGEFGYRNETKYLREAVDAGVHVVWIAPRRIDASQPVPHTSSRFTSVEEASTTAYAELVDAIGDALVTSVTDSKGM